MQLYEIFENFRFSKKNLTNLLQFSKTQEYEASANQPLQGGYDCYTICVIQYDHLELLKSKSL